MTVFICSSTCKWTAYTLGNYPYTNVTRSIVVSATYIFPIPLRIKRTWRNIISRLENFNFKKKKQKKLLDRRKILKRNYPKGYPVTLHDVKIVLLVLDLVALPRLPSLQNKGRNGTPWSRETALSSVSRAFPRKQIRDFPRLSERNRSRFFPSRARRSIQQQRF